MVIQTLSGQNSQSMEISQKIFDANSNGNFPFWVLGSTDPTVSTGPANGLTLPESGGQCRCNVGPADSKGMD